MESIPSNLAQIAYETKLDINLTPNDFKCSYVPMIYFITSISYIISSNTKWAFVFQLSNLRVSSNGLNVLSPLIYANAYLSGHQKYNNKYNCPQKVVLFI